jgi:hypothetical protein
MSDKPHEESDEDERVEGWKRLLREEAARIAARTENEDIKARIAKFFETWCQLVSDPGGQVEDFEKQLKAISALWETMLKLSLHAPVRSYPQLPTEGRSLSERWRDLCLWLAVIAHQIIGETNSPKLKSDIRERLHALTHETQRPQTHADLRSRVTTFETTAGEWTDARMETVLSRPPGRRESD